MDPYTAIPDAAANTHMIADQHLYALAQRLRAYDGITTDLRDNVLHVARLSGGRVERISIAGREVDGGRLWLYDTGRRPIAPAGHPDAPLAVVRLVRDEA